MATRARLEPRSWPLGMLLRPDGQTGGRGVDTVELAHIVAAGGDEDAGACTLRAAPCVAC